MITVGRLLQTSSGTRSRRNGHRIRSGSTAATAARTVPSSTAVCHETSCPARRSSIHTRWARPLNDEQSRRILTQVSDAGSRGAGRRRPPPGARAAHVAVRAGRRTGPASAGWPPTFEAAAQEIEEAHGVPDRRRRRRRRASSTATARRSSPPPARRCSTRRSSPATRRRSRCTPRRATGGWRSSCATAGRASTVGGAGDRRGVRESIVGRMERHGGRAAIHAAPGGGGPRSSSCSSGGGGVMSAARASSSSTTTRCFAPACAPSSTGSSTSSATPPPSPRRSR